MAEKLTDARVRAIPPLEAGRCTHMDCVEPGLELRVYADGRRVFALRRSVNGKDVRITIGAFSPPHLTLKIARARAGKLKARLLTEGDFRQREKEEGLAIERARSFTVNDLCDAWLQDHKKHIRARTAALYEYGVPMDRHSLTRATARLLPSMKGFV